MISSFYCSAHYIWLFSSDVKCDRIQGKGLTANEYKMHSTGSYGRLLEHTNAQ